MLRTIRPLAVAPVVAAALALSACGGGAPGGSASSPAPNSPPAQAGAVPPSLFAADAPTDAVPLAMVRGVAGPGDFVMFEARVGGRREPFVDGRAIFSVADPGILSCDQLHGDSCKTPWDYCCEPKDNLLANLASIQVVDRAGEPLHAPLRGVQGLMPLKTVIITGTVINADPAGGFVVNAQSIHVRGG